MNAFFHVIFTGHSFWATVKIKKIQVSWIPEDGYFRLVLLDFRSFQMGDLQHGMVKIQPF
jgi:hypothetical protein